MIRKRENRRRIYYVPGMISLIVIPLLCFYHFYKVDAFAMYGTLDLMIPNKDEFEKYKIADLRKYQVFEFNDVKVKELERIKELRFFVRDIVKKYDTINGAKIHFGPKTDYDTFVNVITIMTEEEVPTWALFSDNMYAVAHAKPKVKKDHRFFCGTPKYSKENTIRMGEENRKKELNVFLFSFLKQQWIVFLGYLGIVFLNIFALVKFNKNR